MDGLLAGAKVGDDVSADDATELEYRHHSPRPTKGQT